MGQAAELAEYKQDVPRHYADDPDLDPEPLDRAREDDDEDGGEYAEEASR